MYNFEKKSIYLHKKSIICMLVYFQCLTHTTVYATANLYVCAPNTRGGHAESQNTTIVQQ